jgi:type VII secretion integral membrane protein EccD
LTSTTTTSAAHTGHGPRATHSAELCRLTVLSAHSQVDLAVPLRVPLTAVIPGIVDTIVNHSNLNEFDHSTEQFEPVDWTLSKVGRAPLAPMLSLHEHGIRDGELLVLEAADTAAPPPLFDDIMYTVAATDADIYRRWTPITARVVGSSAALVAALIAALALVLGDTGLIGAVCGGVTSLVLTVTAVVAARVYADTASSITLGCTAVPLAFVSGALCVPGTVLSAHLLLGSAFAAAVTLICLRLCGAGLAVFTTLLVVLLAAASTFAVTTTLPEARTATVSSAVIAAALIVLTFTARLSMLFARLPLPLFRRRVIPSTTIATECPSPSYPG